MRPDMPTQSGGHDISRVKNGWRTGHALNALVVAIAFGVLAAALPNARAAEPAAAAQTPLTGLLSLRYLRCRSGAPIPVVWKLEWSEQAIAEGDLDYEIEDGNQSLGRFRLPDLVLAPGGNVFNAMLPPLVVFSSSTPITIRARFHSGTRTFELAEQSLRVPSRFAQWFNLGIVSGTNGRPSRDESRLFESITLERFLPPTDVRNKSTTVALELQTSELPNEPLTLCNFDVVVLLPAALVELRDDQAAALRKWVTAGGSLCVIAGVGLSPRHAALVNELLAEATGHEAFTVDARGHLTPGEGPDGTILSARKGLGRVVILRQALMETLPPDSEKWLFAAGFLMKERRDQPTNVVPLGDAGLSVAPPDQWDGQLPGPATQATGRGNTSNPSSSAPRSKSKVQSPQPAFQRPQSANPFAPGAAPSVPGGQWRVRSTRPLYDPSYLIGSELSPPPLGTLDGFFQILMPRDVQVVPLGMIAAILAAYVVTIGPVDYFVLGLLRMRRLTWILFPVVTITFAGFTLWLSRWYLGTNDSRRAIEVCDMVQGGAVARQTRIELLFLSRQRAVDTEVQNGVFSQIGLGLMPDPRRPGLQVASDGGRINQSFVGRFPSRYMVDQAIPQWTPVANRLFWIDPPPVKVAGSQRTDQTAANPQANFNWDDPGDPTSDSGRQALAARIARAFGNTACAVVYRGQSEPLYVLNSFGSLRSWQPHLERFAPIYGVEQIVHDISAPSPEKLFSLASQVSPNGSPGLEDLALLDQSDPRQSLLVIAVESDSKLTLYRRLYVGAP
jgi:hypothetical protein